jgi:hypothetical protein
MGKIVKKQNAVRTKVVTKTTNFLLGSRTKDKKAKALCPI